MDIGVSIIICTYNGVARLSKTLNSVLLLNTGIAKELILVDNSSTEDIERFCKKYFSQQTFKISYKFLREERPGLCYARIAGIFQASYPYILFCDDDNALFPDYLDIGVKIFAKYPKVGVIGGKGITSSSIALPEWFPIYQRSYAVGSQNHKNGIIDRKPGHVYGAGSFFRTNIMLSILKAGFYPSFKGRTAKSLLSGDDLEWCWLMQLSGYEIYYEEELKFYHELSPKRLTTDYYMNMKSGTAVGTAFSFTYQTYFKNPNLSSIGFLAKYYKAHFKAWLLYNKNKISQVSSDWNIRLGLSILKSKNQSYANYREESVQLYKNLKSIFNKDQKLKI